MRPKIKKVVRRASALIDADPSFVSLVPAGANGAPFTVVKQEKKPMKINKRKGLPKNGGSVKKTGKKVRSNENEQKSDKTVETETVIKQFVLDKGVYENEEAVKAFIDDSDFEGETRIEETDDSFIVHNSDVENLTVLKESSIEIDEEEGATAVVARVEKTTESNDEDDEDDEDDDVSASKSSKSSDDEDDDETDEDDDETDEDDDGEDDDDSAEKSDDDKKKPRKKSSDEVSDEDDEATVVSKREQFLSSLDDDEDDDAQRVAKFDHYEVFIGDAGSSFAELLKAGASDGAAPGFDEVMWTFAQAVCKQLRSTDGDINERLGKDADDFVSVVVALDNLFSDIVETEKSDVEKITGPEKAKSLRKWAKSFGREIVAETAKKNADPAPSTANHGVADRKQFTEGIADAVKSAILPVMEKVEGVEQRLEKIATSRRQVSKALTAPDASDSEAANGNTSEQDEVAARSRKAAESVTKIAFGQ